jgi:hypothetical protein
MYGLPPRVRATRTSAWRRPSAATAAARCSSLLTKARLRSSCCRYFLTALLSPSGSRESSSSNSVSLGHQRSTCTAQRSLVPSDIHALTRLRRCCRSARREFGGVLLSPCKTLAALRSSLVVRPNPTPPLSNHIIQWPVKMAASTMTVVEKSATGREVCGAAAARRGTWVCPGAV